MKKGVYYKKVFFAMNKRLEEVLMMNLKRSKMSLLLSILVMLVLTSCTRQQPITIGFVVLYFMMPYLIGATQMLYQHGTELVLTLIKAKAEP